MLLKETLWRFATESDDEGESQTANARAACRDPRLRWPQDDNEEKMSRVIFQTTLRQWRYMSGRAVREPSAWNPRRL